MFAISPTLRGGADLLARSDRQYHAYAGIGLGYLGANLANDWAGGSLSKWESALIGVGTSLVVGIGKELVDQKQDSTDVVATIYGGALGATIFLTFDID